MSFTFLPETIERFPQPLFGKVTVAITPHQTGQVKCQATYWAARFYDPNDQNELSPHQTVMVVGRQGLTLLVMPIGAVPAVSFSGQPLRESTRPYPSFPKWRQQVSSALAFLLS